MKCIVLSFYLICAVFLFISCKKNSISPQKNKAASSGYVVTDSAAINGYWELRILYGCQTPNCNPYFEPGNGNTWKFTDSMYVFSVKSTSPVYAYTDSGRYSAGKDTSQVTGRLMDYLILKEDKYDRLFFEIVKDTLTVYRGYIPADGTIEKFVRF